MTIKDLLKFKIKSLGPHHDFIDKNSGIIYRMFNSTTTSEVKTGIKLHRFALWKNCKTYNRKDFK